MGIEVSNENELGKPGVPDGQSIMLPGPVKQPATLYDLLGNPLKKDPRERFYLPGDGAIDKRQVILFADTDLLYPDLWLQVYIAGNQYEQAQFASFFSRGYCQKADSLDDADLVVFTGGSDVDPQLYGEKAHSSTRFSAGRDNDDIAIFLECKKQGIPMMGVCRGFQFLHVMHGGKLYQDIDGHQGDHKMLDVKTRTTIERVSSVHHQSVVWDKATGLEVLGTTTKSLTRWKNDKDKEEGVKPDIEAGFYRETCSFGVQGHPEYQGYHYFSVWCLERINEFINENPDIVLLDVLGKGRRRMDPNLIKQREAIEAQMAKGRPKSKVTELQPTPKEA